MTKNVMLFLDIRNIMTYICPVKQHLQGNKYMKTISIIAKQTKLDIQSSCFKTTQTSLHLTFPDFLKLLGNLTKAYLSDKHGLSYALYNDLELLQYQMESKDITYQVNLDSPVAYITKKVLTNQQSESFQNQVRNYQ